VSQINVGRVILGGLLAGLVINVGESVLNLFVVAQGMEEALRQRNLNPLGVTPIVGFIAFAFVLGVFTVWLYAAIRPRFGPGVRTAIIAGLAVWFFAYVYGNTAWVLMGFFPAALVAIITVWGLVEIVLASIAGAWAYRE
jgi:hypothetical protein